MPLARFFFLFRSFAFSFVVISFSFSNSCLSNRTYIAYLLLDYWRLTEGSNGWNRWRSTSDLFKLMYRFDLLTIEIWKFCFRFELIWIRKEHSSWKKMVNEAAGIGFEPGNFRSVNGILKLIEFVHQILFWILEVFVCFSFSFAIY